MSVSTAALAHLGLLERARAEGKITTHSQPERKKAGWQKGHGKNTRQVTWKAFQRCERCRQRFNSWASDKLCFTCRRIK